MIEFARIWKHLGVWLHGVRLDLTDLSARKGLQVYPQRAVAHRRRRPMAVLKSPCQHVL